VRPQRLLRGPSLHKRSYLKVIDEVCDEKNDVKSSKGIIGTTDIRHIKKCLSSVFGQSICSQSVSQPNSQLLGFKSVNQSLIWRVRFAQLWLWIFDLMYRGINLWTFRTDLLPSYSRWNCLYFHSLLSSSVGVSFFLAKVLPSPQ
jgi:hypothetical protein